jgi:hypothetical protein
LINGQVVFAVQGTVGVLPHHPCLQRLFVEDKDRRLIWFVQRKKASDCKNQPGFPLIFNRVPTNFASVGGNYSLRPAAFYIIEGDDEQTGAAYVGGFRLSADRQHIATFALGDAEVQDTYRRWIAEGKAYRPRPYPSDPSSGE